MASAWGPILSTDVTNSVVSTSSIDASTSSIKGLYGAELDPVGFSFFLSTNLSVANEDLQRLLEAPDVIDRLRLVSSIHYLVKADGTDRLSIQFLKDRSQKHLGCSVCRHAIAAKQEVFSLPGAEGMVGAYVNPHG